MERPGLSTTSAKPRIITLSASLQQSHEHLAILFINFKSLICLFAVFIIRQMSQKFVWKHNLAKSINITEMFKIKLVAPELKRTQCDDAVRSRRVGGTEAAGTSHWRRRSGPRGHTCGSAGGRAVDSLPPGSWRRSFRSVTWSNKSSDVTARWITLINTGRVFRSGPVRGDRSLCSCQQVTSFRAH